MITNFRWEHAYLSNFYAIPIQYNGFVWRSAEHLFQAFKASNAEDVERIWSASSAKEAKHLGKIITLRADWETIKLDVMRIVVANKFSQHPYLRAKLLSTGKKELIEGNSWHDNFWGACTCYNCRNKVKLNWLGKILMETRHSMGGTL